LRRCDTEACGECAGSSAEDAAEAVHRVQPGEYRTTEQAPYSYPLGVHSDIHDAVEHGKREQAHGQHEKARSEGRTQQRTRERE
jgi:hypothetical protein